ncbi:septal ring lytic transglycosylase RlpA family protein [Sphingomonas parva]|uniref:Endolytic peptidoglycan transglycosylase RlpA n=1 Tax=Sphingomonas parva TaxID=2555898 RepID=A0A4Y8ZKL5_9SPHN|nr:septal ring lytic transglycosylase RlpA family protein [Sphingomonas parva]TFI56560.1 septal ring lytic transglycosylase RlpA family protein [Sphingomonas parva]
MRKGAATAAVLAGLLATGPSFAVAADASRIDTLATSVAALEEEPIKALSVPAAEEKIAAFEAIGGGEASYYGAELAGNRTASGERFNPSALTAAHRTLPLGTKLRVTNKANGKSVIVRVNDRGPFLKHRVIDVSLAAAREIAMLRSGKAQVTLEIVRA